MTENELKTEQRPTVRLGIVGGDLRALGINWPKWCVAQHFVASHNSRSVNRTLESSLRSGKLDALIVLTRWSSNDVKAMVRKTATCPVRYWDRGLDALREQLENVVGDDVFGALIQKEVREREKQERREREQALREKETVVEKKIFENLFDDAPAAKNSVPAVPVVPAPSAATVYGNCEFCSISLTAGNASMLPNGEAVHVGCPVTKTMAHKTVPASIAPAPPVPPSPPAPPAAIVRGGAWHESEVEALILAYDTCEGRGTTLVKNYRTLVPASERTSTGLAAKLKELNGTRRIEITTALMAAVKHVDKYAKRKEPTLQTPRGVSGEWLAIDALSQIIGKSQSWIGRQKSEGNIRSRRLPGQVTEYSSADAIRLAQAADNGYQLHKATRVADQPHQLHYPPAPPQPVMLPVPPLVPASAALDTAPEKNVMARIRYILLGVEVGEKTPTEALAAISKLVQS